MSRISIPTAAGWVLWSFLVASCGAVGPQGRCHQDSGGIILTDGEVRLERTLDELDMIEMEIYSFKDAPGRPIDTCIHSNRDVIERDLAWRLMTGKTLAGQEKAAEDVYYALLQKGTPAELLPIVHLRKYYHEGLRKCVLALVHQAPQETQEESAVSVFLTANFEAETKRGVVVVDFMTHWCGPCKKMARDLERLARDYKGKLKIGRLDVDRHMPMAERFHVRTFPTLLIFKNGKEVARFSDIHAHEELKAWAERVLQNLDSD